jgi:hypothetical protein
MCNTARYEVKSSLHVFEWLCKCLKGSAFVFLTVSMTHTLALPCRFYQDIPPNEPGYVQEQPLGRDIARFCDALAGNDLGLV